MNVPRRLEVLPRTNQRMKKKVGLEEQNMETRRIYALSLKIITIGVVDLFSIGIRNKHNAFC